MSPLVSHAAVDSYSRRGNITLLTLSEGAAEVGWISESSFRFARCWQPSCLSREPVREPVEVKLTATAAAIVWETRYVRLELSRSTLALRAVLVSDGSPLFAQEPIERVQPAGLAAAIRLEQAERLFGFAAYGLNAEGKLDVRGERITTATPFFLSSRGYGMYFGSPGSYDVDAAASEPGQLRVRNTQARQWEQFVYYGPTPKEILEEHHIIAPEMPQPRMDDLRRGKPAYARDIPSLADLAAASMSGVLVPGLKQVIAWSEFLSGPQWEPYLYTYLCEARDRGIPVVRPLAMQFPSDGAAASINTSFMIGDEVLIATRERTYLPPGIWTDLASGAVHRGRQTVATPDGPRRFARNGTILPVQSPNGLELHYFPRLGAEFFLSEEGLEDISQVHAAPAGEQLRLEIESKVERDYVWVIHNVGRARSVAAIGAETPGMRYDADARQLRLAVRAGENSDIIFNIVLEEPL